MKNGLVSQLSISGTLEMEYDLINVVFKKNKLQVIFDVSCEIN
jgi:hypothetical protein